MGENICDFELGKFFLVLTSKTTIHFLKADKLDFIKIKNFCASKYIMKKVKKAIHRMAEYI